METKAYRTQITMISRIDRGILANPGNHGNLCSINLPMQKKDFYFSIPFLLLVFSPTFVFAKNLTIPFTPQAPYGNWSQPWQDTCEETAILMVDYFYNNKKLADKSVAKQEILRILNIKNNAYGKSLDENAE